MLRRVWISNSRAVMIATLIGLSACGCNGKSDETIARVGGLTITKNALQHWATVLSTIGAVSARMPGRMPITQQALRFLVESARIVGEAHEEHVDVSSADARAMLQRFHLEQSANFAPEMPARVRDLLSGRGETVADQVWLVRVHVLAEALQRRQLVQAANSFSAAEVRRYYLANKREFVLPERRSVAVIETYRKVDSEAAKREIDSGLSLRAVVERRDDEPGVGGFKSDLVRRDLGHAYELNYFRAKPHVLVGPLKAQIYYLFEVTAIVPPRLQTLDEGQARIRRALALGGQQLTLSQIKRALDQKWIAKTACRTAYTFSQCGSSLN